MHNIIPSQISERSQLQTSTSKSFSFCFKEHALLSARIKSLKRPCLGTVTVQTDGKALPSQVKTVIVIVRVMVSWSGKERYMKGSNVMETLLHTGQTNVDLNWPCQMENTWHQSRSISMQVNKFRKAKTYKDENEWQGFCQDVIERFILMWEKIEA